MSTSITVAFITQYESEVKLAFQRFGATLLNTIRRKPNVVGNTVVFQKLGKGAATTKARHGDVTPMNAVHTNVSATMVDFYGPEFVDKLDEMKVNIDERTALAKTGAGALGRKVDNQIVTAMDTTTNNAASTSGLTRAAVLGSAENLHDNDVFEEGRMYFSTPFNGWADLLTISEFASMDFVRDNLPWPEGKEAKRWLGMLVFPSAAMLDIKSGSTFQSMMYHEDALGYGHNAQITAEINYVPIKVAHLVNHFMSGQAVMIDDVGCRGVPHT